MTDPERHRMMPLRNYLAKQRQMCYNDGMQYCLSDPHGCYDLFCRLLEKIRFDGGDTLYVLGDFIDKGPDSVRLVRLQQIARDAIGKEGVARIHISLAKAFVQPLRIAVHDVRPCADADDHAKSISHCARVCQYRRGGRSARHAAA